MTKREALMLGLWANAEVAVFLPAYADPILLRRRYLEESETKPGHYALTERGFSALAQYGQRSTESQWSGIPPRPTIAAIPQRGRSRDLGIANSPEGNDPGV